MINWKNPLKEMPISGTHVWIMLRQDRRDDLLSCELLGVEVFESVNKEQYFVNNDDIGGGVMKWRLDQVAAWADKDAINLPERV